MIQARHVGLIAGATLVGGLLVVLALWEWERSIPASRHFMAGVRLADRNKPEAALVEFRRAAEKDPRDVETRIELANTLSWLKRYDEALAECGMAVSLDPLSPRAHMSLGLALKSERRWGEAIAEFRQAIRLDSHYRAPRHQVCSTLMYAGRLDEAVAECRRNIRLDPRGIGVGLVLARALEKQGKLDQAIAAGRQVQRIDRSYLGSEVARLLYAKSDYAGAWREVHRLQARRAFPLGDRDKEFLAKLQSKMPEPRQ